MLNKLGERIARLFGEPNMGLNLDYQDISRLDLGIEPFWKYLPYDTYDPQTQLFYNRDSTGFVLKGAPIAGATLKDQEQLNKFFSQPGNLPEGSSMQFLLIASPKIGEKLDYWRQYRTHPAFQKLADRRCEFLAQKAFDSRSPIRDFRVIISYTLPGLITSPIEKENLLNLRQNLQESLKNIGLPTRVMDDKSFVTEVGNLVNFEKTIRNDQCWWSDYEEISRLIAAPDMGGRVSEKAFYLKGDETAVHTFIPNVTPKHWALAHMDKLFGDLLDGSETIPCPFMVHYGFFVSEKQGRKRIKATSKRESLENACRAGLAKWQPGVHQEFQEASEILTELQKGERIIDASLSLTTFCSPKDLPKVQSAVESIWSLHGWSSKSVRYGHLILFLTSLPMMWTTGTVRKMLGLFSKAKGAGTSLSHLGQTRRTVTKESQNLLPLVGEWMGQIAPGIPLVGRRGQLAFWSPFDGMLIPGKEFNQPVGGYSFCIVGVPGSGKSFLCNEIIMSTVAVGGRAFVLDKGRSFAPLCLAMGGQHIDFDFSTEFSLNPFTHIPEGNTKDEVEDRGHLFKGLMAIITQMAFASGQQTDAEVSFLREAIYAVWKTQKSKGNIDAIRDYLNGQKDSRAKDIARCLIDFTSQGAYGRYFNPPANIDLNSNFIVVETDNLEEPLKSVMIMLSLTQSWQKMIRSDRKIPYLILIDEAWDLLRAKAFGEYIEAIVLTARKYRFSLGVATQSLMHFFKDGATGPKAAWENSAWKLIFNQESDTLSGLKDHPQLSEFVRDGYRETLLRSLQPARGFSEFALSCTDMSPIPLRLYCDPYATLLYSTNAQEVSLINDLRTRGKSIDEAIEHILESRQKGEK